MDHILTKILLFIFLSPLFIGCSISKNIEKGKLILRSNEILVNGNKIPKDSLKPLLTQNKNNYFIGFPFSAYLNESSKDKLSKVNIADNTNIEIINKIKTKKAILKSSSLIFDSVLNKFLSKIFFGFTSL